MPINHNRIKSIIDKAYNRKPIIDQPTYGTPEVPNYSPQREETPQERERRDRKWREFNEGYQGPLGETE